MLLQAGTACFEAQVSSLHFKGAHWPCRKIRLIGTVPAGGDCYRPTPSPRHGHA
jgi:hypothetical protein